jgi:hypothetical protein
LILQLFFILSTVWIVQDVGARFQSAPLRLPVQHTLWSEDLRLEVATIEPGPPVELGVAFRTAVAGSITGLRFYKIAGDVGPHTGSLWTRKGGKGKRLATVTFVNESESGWQEATLTPPIAVDANRLLYVSYFAPTGGQLVLGEGSTERGRLTVSYAPAFRWPPIPSDDDRPVNAYRHGGPGFPHTGATDRVFWVDVVFVPDTSVE